MSRYEWPPGPRRDRDRVARRLAWNIGRDAAGGEDTVEAARALRRAAARAPGDGAPGVALAPTRADELWLPIGPTTTAARAGRGGVAHRRAACATSRSPTTASGSTPRARPAALWYSADAGATWESVGTFAGTADRSTVMRASNTLACGAVHVVFAPAGTADPHTVDEVWVGTGEPNPRQQPTDFGNLGYYGGVGILHAVRPVAAVRGGTPDPWTREAQPRAGAPPYAGLRGAGVFAFASDPADRRRILAATTRGLHFHDPAAAGPDRWSIVSDPTWDGRAGSPGSANLVVTDVAWIAGRIWVAIRQAGTALTGLWRSDAGPAGPYQEVVLPGARTGAGEPRVLRLGIAVAPSDPDVLYVLGSGPRLWRVDGPATVRRVNNPLPQELFGSAGADSSDYALAIAVDPASPRRFLIGGMAVQSDGLPAAAMYRLTVPAVAPGAGAGWSTDYTGGNVFDAALGRPGGARRRAPHPLDHRDRRPRGHRRRRLPLDPLRRPRLVRLPHERDGGERAGLRRLARRHGRRGADRLPGQRRPAAAGRHLAARAAGRRRRRRRLRPRRARPAGRPDDGLALGGAGRSVGEPDLARRARTRRSRRSRTRRASTPTRRSGCARTA